MSEQTDEKAIVTLADDLLGAYIIFRRPEGGALLTYEQLLDKLKKANVVYGINHEELRRLSGDPDKLYDQETKVASGLPPEDGHNAWIEFRFKMTRDKTPKVLPDGSVDHHAMEYAESVRKGSVVAELFAEGAGTNGVNVLGAAIEAKPGKPKVLPVGKNTEVSPDGLKLLAKIDGMIEIVNSKICVIPVLDIRGDIGPATGNLNFIGDITIRGNVLSGYNVSATGSVRVTGCVEASVVRAGGDIVIEQGVKGLSPAKVSEGVLVARGNITSKFIEEATVTANGTVRADTLLNSTVKSYSNIVIAGKKGNITGGKTYALETVICDTAGSNAGAGMKLMCGLTDEETEGYRTAGEEIERLNTLLEDERSAIKMLENSPGLNAVQAKRLNESQKKVEAYQAAMEDKKNLRRIIESAKNRRIAGKIVVNKTLYPPADITINRFTKTYGIEKQVNVMFYVKDGDIVAASNV